MSEEIKQPEIVKPKRERKPKVEAIVPVEPEVRLGSLAISNPAELVSRASELATVLADIINKQGLFSIITNKRGQKQKYVRCEGWTTMGAMLGVLPVEEYCRLLPSGNGFEAKINLIRSRDGMLVGSASAECTRDESKWKSNDSYSLRSMALTRATGKAFRLSFSWIIKLAGFEPTPAEEMLNSEEDASVDKKWVEEEVERQKAGETPREAPNKQQRPSGYIPSLFYAIQPSGLYAVEGDKSLLEKLWKPYQKFWLQQDRCYMVNEEVLEQIKFQCESNNPPIPFTPLKAAQ